MVGIELEVLAKKFDRFGWERDRGGMAHDRMVTDWMDALHDYPLDEIKAACVGAVLSNPSKMPNEGHIRAVILSNRAKALAKLPKQIEQEPESNVERISEERANEIMAEVGFMPKRFND